MPEHYLRLEHQTSIMNFIQQMLPKIFPEQMDRHSGMDIDYHPVATGQSSLSLTTTTDSSMQPQMAEVYEAINTIANGIQTLNDDALRLSNDTIRIRTNLDVVRRDVDTLKASIEEQSSSIEGLRPNQEVLNQEIQSLKQKVEDLQSVSYDGTLMWRIPNLKEKMGE